MRMKIILAALALGVLLLAARSAYRARPCAPTPRDCMELQSDLGYMVAEEIEKQGQCRMPLHPCRE